MIRKLLSEKVQDFWDKRIKKFGYFGVLWEKQPSWSAYVDKLQTHYLKRWLDKVNSQDKVLDVGCGTGRFSFRLAKKAKEVFGVDTSKEGILFCQEEAKGKNVSNTKFLIAKASNLPFKDEYFDKIFSITCLQHITLKKEFENSLKELLRILKKNGKIVLIECTSDKRKDEYVNSFPLKFWIETFEKYGGKLEFCSGVDINLLRKFGFSFLAHFRDQKTNDFLTRIFTFFLFPLEYTLPKITRNFSWYSLLIIKKNEKL